MKLEISTSTLTAGQIPAFLKAKRNPDIRRAASRAQATLLHLCGVLKAGDLLCQAICQPDALAWLNQLIDHAEATRHAIVNERRHRDTLLAADGESRATLDCAALDLMGIERTAHRGNLDLAKSHRSGDDYTRRDLTAAGLDAAEIDEIITARRASAKSTASTATAAAAVHAERLHALEAFLGDPLRDRGHLGEALADEASQRAAALKHRGRDAAHMATLQMKRPGPKYVHAMVDAYALQDEAR